jgi:hypothetical protein
MYDKVHNDDEPYRQFRFGDDARFFAAPIKYIKFMKQNPKISHILVFAIFSIILLSLIIIPIAFF